MAEKATKKPPKTVKVLKHHPAAIRLEHALQDADEKIEKAERKLTDLQYERRSLRVALDELYRCGIYGNVDPDEEKETQLEFDGD